MARTSQIPPELAAEMTPAVRAFVESLLDRIDALEARLGKTPQNSSLPPSSQHPHAKPAPKPKPSGKLPGGQPGHKKHQRALVPPERVNETVTLKPDHSRCCGQRLRGSDPDPLRHQVWELPEIQPIITEYRRQRLRCACGTITCAPLPPDVPTGQSGPRLVALATLLMAHFRQSKRRVSLFCESVLNIPCSPGLVVKLQNIGAQALSPCYDELAAALPQSEAVNLDETGTGQGPHKGWIWAAATATFTLFAIRLTRSAQVVRELLGEAFGGAITTDRYSGYNEYQRRQVCWAHLLRDFQALIDAGGAGKRIGTRLMEIGREMFGHWHRARDGTITRESMRRHVRRLQYPLWDALEDGQRCRHAPTAGL